MVDNAASHDASRRILCRDPDIGKGQRCAGQSNARDHPADIPTSFSNHRLTSHECGAVQRIPRAEDTREASICLRRHNFTLTGSGGTLPNYRVYLQAFQRASASALPLAI
jgi:predicted component of type VI protein secretion system